MGLMNTVMRKGNALHVALYRRTGGRRFNTIKGLPVALLSVKGRKSGNLHTTPCVKFDHDGSWLVVGSAGGMPTEPQWFKNLRAADRASLQIGDVEHEVSVHVAEGAERDALWQKVVSEAPFFAGYQKKATNRTIPIAVLTPV